MSKPWAWCRRYGRSPPPRPRLLLALQSPAPPPVVPRSLQHWAATGCDRPQAGSDVLSAPLLPPVQQAHRLRGLWSTEALEHRFGQEDSGGNGRVRWAQAVHRGLGLWGHSEEQGAQWRDLVLAQGQPHRAGAAGHGVFTGRPMGPFPPQDPSVQALLQLPLPQRSCWASHPACPQPCPPSCGARLHPWEGDAVSTLHCLSQGYALVISLRDGGAGPAELPLPGASCKDRAGAAALRIWGTDRFY